MLGLGLISVKAYGYKTGYSVMQGLQILIFNSLESEIFVTINTGLKKIAAIWFDSTVKYDCS